MHLSKEINLCLDNNRSKFSGFVSYRALVRRLNKIFNGFEGLKFKAICYNDIDVNEYLISGLYDQLKKIKYVIINLSSYSDELLLEDSMWEDFKFSVSQTIQHEAIHQHQFKYRTNFDYDEKPDFRFLYNDGGLSDEREYLSDIDEIDAYAHDIAMEIKHFYPQLDPYYVLKTISYKRKLRSYSYYRKTFRGCDWSQIRKKLLLKTYKWIPHV